jgi:RNA polymerase sigma-70 factor, ECF subfamily
MNVTSSPLEESGRGAWDLFLSYTTEDSNWVRPLADKLTSLSLKVLDPDATPSEFWGMSREEVLTAIFPVRCSAILVALSAKYSTSEHNICELAVIAEATMFSGGSSIVLPVRLDDSPVPEAMRIVAILDARGSSPELVAEKVASRLREWKEMERSTTLKVSQETEQAFEQDVVKVFQEVARSEVARLRHRFPDVDADEVVSDAMLQMLKAKHVPKANLTSYFRTVVSRLAMDYYRRQGAERLIKNYRGFENIEALAAPSIESENIEAIKRAIEMLSGLERQVISMYYLGGLTTSDVAEQLGISQSTTRVRLHRALEKLRSMLKAEA